VGEDGFRTHAPERSCPCARYDLHSFIEKGMQLRDKYKKLSEYLDDKKSFRDVLSGKTKIEKAVTNTEQSGEAFELLEVIKKAV